MTINNYFKNEKLFKRKWILFISQKNKKKRKFSVLNNNYYKLGIYYNYY